MASDLVRFSVAIPEGLLAQLDAYTARRGVATNRSEAIRDLVRERLVEEEVGEAHAEVVGSITMVYSHHAPGLSQRLDEIQHAHTAEIVSTMHVHLDHDNCLETVAVRGTSERIHELADRLLGIKGVRHGKLVCVATEGDGSCCCDHPHGGGEGHDHPHGGGEHKHGHGGEHHHAHDQQE